MKSDGEDVTANQLLIRLDDTVTKANLQIVSKMLDQLEMRAARLRAERDGAVALSVPSSLENRVGNPDDNLGFELMLGAKDLHLYLGHHPLRFGDRGDELASFPFKARGLPAHGVDAVRRDELLALQCREAFEFLLDQGDLLALGMDLRIDPHHLFLELPNAPAQLFHLLANGFPP